MSTHRAPSALGSDPSPACIALFVHRFAFAFGGHRRAGLSPCLASAALLHPLGDPHGTPEREVEAESTAFVVCHALGLDTGAAAFPYVATWAKRDGADPLEAVATSGERMSKTARTILDALCGAEDRTGAAAAA